MNFLKWLAYSIAFGAFVWFVFFKPLSTTSATKIADSTTDDTENIDQSTIDNSAIEDVQDSKNETIDEKYEEPVSENINAIEEVTPPKNTTSGSINLNSKYLIVVGSFGKKSNAERMLRRVQKSGKDGVITYISGLHRVVTASSDDQNDAGDLRDHFTHIYKEQAFVLTQ